MVPSDSKAWLWLSKFSKLPPASDRCVWLTFPPRPESTTQPSTYNTLLPKLCRRPSSGRCLGVGRCFPKFRFSAFPAWSLDWRKFVGLGKSGICPWALFEGNCQRNTGVTDGRGAFGRHRLLSEGFFALSGTEVVPAGALDSACFCNSLIIREPVAGIEPATY